MISLALKYRPRTFDDLVEQNSIKTILSQQLNSKTFKQAYLFVGPAGTGKTTCARIMANEINNGIGSPIEIDAASRGNVDDIRELSMQAKSKPLDAEYKVFIIDECHCLSSAGWSAMLKLIEEPPTTAIFILATTDVQKVPKTIISRCQRFDFQKISQSGIVDRLEKILYEEGYGIVSDEPIEYIAKLSDGGMRDALTLLDKCLAYSKDLTLVNVVNALGTINYEVMFDLTWHIQTLNQGKFMEMIEDIYNQGKDLKLFVKQYTQFILDVYKLLIGCDWKYVQLPKLKEYEDKIDAIDIYMLFELLETLVKLNSDIKYSSSPRYDIEAQLLLMILDHKWRN